MDNKPAFSICVDSHYAPKSNAFVSLSAPLLLPLPSSSSSFLCPGSSSLRALPVVSKPLVSARRRGGTSFRTRLMMHLRSDGQFNGRDDNNDSDGNGVGNDNHLTLSRRTLLRNAAFASLGLFSGSAFNNISGKDNAAHAINGLRIFPLREPLTNTYYLMRASETKSDFAGVVHVNPVEKLSIQQHGLTRRGADQARDAASALIESGLSGETWIWPSVTLSAFETAEVLASSLRVGRERIVPEFAFLDARGVGKLEGSPTDVVSKIIHEHDRSDYDWKPELGEDGTPNDSAHDVFIRIRQLLSKLETQYFAQDIIVIAPDSDPLSVWQAAISGMDLTQHVDMWYAPGEVRLVREQVVDAYNKVVEQPFAKTIFKPS